MKTLCRLLVLLLTLVATGVVPLVPAFAGPACVHDAATDDCDTPCGDEHPAAPCSDCAPDCSFCLCCPSRAVSTARFSVPSRASAVDQALVLSTARPVPRLDGARIFHPPRA